MYKLLTDTKPLTGYACAETVPALLDITARARGCRIVETEVIGCTCLAFHVG